MEEKDYSEIYINLKEKTFSIKGNSNFVNIIKEYTRRKRRENK